MLKAILFTTAAAAMLAGTAVAQPAMQRGGDRPNSLAEIEARAAEHFAKIDIDGNGAVTRAEADAAREAMRERRAERRAERRSERFDRIDTNNDGQISKAEMDAAHAARAEKRAERGSEWRGKRGHGMRSHRGMRGGMFERADANNDGQVTLAEFTAPMIERFQRVDTNGDGTISDAERTAAREARRAARQSRSN